MVREAESALPVRRTPRDLDHWMELGWRLKCCVRRGILEGRRVDGSSCIEIMVGSTQLRIGVSDVCRVQSAERSLYMSDEGV